jgi:hypothetical protein
MSGTKWALAPASPPPGARSSAFNAVACPSAAAGYAVGDYDATGATRTLVEQRV